MTMTSATAAEVQDRPDCHLETITEVEHYTDHIAVATGAETFAKALRSAIADPGDPESGRARVAEHTWTAKAEQVWDRLQTLSAFRNTASAADPGRAAAHAGTSS